MREWETRRLKTFLTETKEIVGEKSSDYTLLSLTKSGVIVRDMSAGGKFPSDFRTYKIVSSGQIIFCLFDVDETPRTVGLSKHNGMITGAYNIFNITNINPKFLEYYFLAIDDVKGLKPLYTGLRKVINKDIFLQLKILFPPRDEQDQIVRYLDWKVSGINKYVKFIYGESIIDPGVLESHPKSLLSLLTEYRSRLRTCLVSGKRGKKVRRQSKRRGNRSEPGRED